MNKLRKKENIFVIMKDKKERFIKEEKYKKNKIYK